MFSILFIKHSLYQDAGLKEDLYLLDYEKQTCYLDMDEVQKIKFFIKYFFCNLFCKYFFSLVTEEILNGKLYFLCSGTYKSLYSLNIPMTSELLSIRI